MAWGTALKLAELGAKLVAISGPDGYIIDEEGINTPEKIAYMTELNETRNNVVAPFADKFKSAKFFPGRKVWEVPCEIALTCAIQNELGENDAIYL